MKSKVYLLLLVLIWGPIAVFGAPETPVVPPSTATVSCNTDTIEYAASKATGMERFTLSKGNTEGAAQWFAMPSAMTLEGVTIMAGVASDGLTNKTANLIVNVYNSSADSLPTAVPIAVAFITVDTTFQSYAVPLLNPVTLQGDYIIAVEYGSGFAENDTVEVAYSLNGDGMGESLGSAKEVNSQGSFWLELENANAGGDRDFLFAPWINYSLTADFLLPGDTICLNDAVQFINQSSEVAAHRMYNRSISDPMTFGQAYSWTLGDGGVSSDESPMNTYNLTGPKTIVLTTQIQGYYSVCSEPSTAGMQVADRPIAAFMSSSNQVSVGDTVMFVDMSTGSANCEWTFGDGDTLNTCGDQEHVYDTAGTYIVTLTVMSPYGCIERLRDTIEVSPLLNVEAGLQKDQFQIWPNPSSGKVSFQYTGGIATPGNLNVYALDGRKVMTMNDYQGEKTSIDLGQLKAGIYFIRFNTGNDLHTQKLILQN